MDTSLLIAILAGIAFGAIRSYFLSKKENSKANPYLESIVVSLIVYLIAVNIL